MGYSIYIVALLIIAAVWKLGRKAEYGGDRLGRVVTIAVLLLSVAYLGSKALPRSVSYPFDLKEASRIAVSLDGRVQPLDSVARNNLLVISKMYAFRSDWLTWSQVKDFTALAAALIAFGLLLAMLFAGDTASDTLRARGWAVPAALAQVFSPLRNFEPLGKGVIDSFAIACALLLAAGFLALTVRRLDGLRLRG